MKERIVYKQKTYGEFYDKDFRLQHCTTINKSRSKYHFVKMKYKKKNKEKLLVDLMQKPSPR